MQNKIVDDTSVCIRKGLCLQTSSLSSAQSESSRGKKKTVQLREPEYRIHTRLISATSGRSIHYFNNKVQLLTVFYDAIEGHRNLFQTASILHRDISLYNIMIGADGRGFIIDLDYAIDLSENNENKSAQSHRTGILPFMAIGILLHDEEHSFQHDLESFFYVLCWICCVCEGPLGRLRSNDCDRKNLMEWAEGSPKTIGCIKIGMMQRFYLVLDTFSPYFDSLKPFVIQFHKALFKNGVLRNDVSYEVILKLFEDKIQQGGDNNLIAGLRKLKI